MTLDMFGKEEGKIKYPSLFWVCLLVSEAQELKSRFSYSMVTAQSWKQLEDQSPWPGKPCLSALNPASTTLKENSAFLSIMPLIFLNIVN